MNYKFAQLLQNPGKVARSKTEVFIAQPDSQKEELAGRLFVLIELNFNDKRANSITNFLNDSIVQNFYQNEKLILRERMPSLKVEHIFETSLSKTNKHFSEFLKNEKITLNPDDLNITAGIIFKNDLYITNNGKNKAFLIYENKQKQEASPKKANNIATTDENNTKKYSIINVFASKEEPINKQRLFSNVISGNIPNKGNVFICNEALPEYISEKKIINIISSLPPNGAVEQIKNIIKSINTYIPFAGIVIKNTNTDKFSESQNQNTQTSNESISNLNVTENTTDALLAPSGMINIKNILKNPFANANGKKNDFFLKDKIFMERKSNIKQFRNSTFKFLSNLFKAVLNLLSIIKQKNLLKNPLKNIANNSSYGQILKNIYAFLFTKKKFLLVISLIFVIVFVLNINRTKQDNEQIVEEINYKEIALDVEKKLSKIEASLLYSNDEGAKNIIDETSALLEQLPRETEIQKKEYNDFLAKHNSLLEKTRRVTRIDGATKLTDFASLNSRAQVSNITYIDNNKIYAADASNKSIYIYDLFDNYSNTITDLDNPIETLDSPIVYGANDNKQLHYLNKDSIISFNIEDESLSSLNINLENNTDIDTAIYNSKIYLLDKKANNIFRYARTGNNYGSATAWLIDKVDLSDSVDLSIDGYIYVLHQNGNVTKLLRGVIAELKMEKSDPEIAQATKIEVSAEQDYMYILEPIANRLLVFTKDGDYLMQYYSENLDKLKDFSIDEEKEIIYLLNNETLYKFNALHFGID